MDKSQRLLEVEIEQLKGRIETEPDKVWAIAEQCAARSAQILYPEGEIQCLVIMSRCAWCSMDYRKGLKYIKEAHSKLNVLDTDDLLPEILHIHALHYWGKLSTIQPSNIGSTRSNSPLWLTRLKFS